MRSVKKTREFIMPAGRFSGRRYVDMTSDEYKMFDLEHNVDLEGPINLVVTNDLKRTKPVSMKALAKEIQALANIREMLNRTDTITLVTTQPLMWSWLTTFSIGGTIDYTVALARNESMFDILPLPESELILEVMDVRSAGLVNKLPMVQNVSCGVMTSSSRIHWLLGAMRQAGRPDVSVYVNIQTVSPEMRGAST